MSELALKRVSPDGPEWTRLIAERESLLFHQPEWAKVLEEGFNGEAYTLVLERDGEILGGLLGFAYRILWVKFLNFSFPYGGLIGEAPPDGQLAALLAGFSAKNGIARIRIVNSPTLEPTPSEGFDLVPNPTHMLKIEHMDFAEIRAGFKKNILRNVKKAEKSGVVVEEVTDASAGREFYSLYLESMRRNQAIPKYGLPLVESICARILSTGQGAILLARREGRAIAGILVVDSHRMSHYLMGGSSTEDLKYRPNDLLFSEAIRRAADKKHEFFDFLPSGPDDPALVRFKTKWGAIAFDAHTLDLVTRPLSMALFNRIYRLAETRPAQRILRAYRGR